MVRYTICQLAAVSLLVLIPATSKALYQDAPHEVSVQGLITDDNGVPLDTSGVGMTFKIYDGVTAIWEEVHPSVVVDSGIFNVRLGITGSLDTVAFKSDYDLGITVGGDAEMNPRTPFAASAFARALPGMYTFYRDDGVLSEGYNVVGGASVNEVGSGVTGATIAGGGGFFSGSPRPNSVEGDFGAVGGGFSNTAAGTWSTVGGGTSNSANANQSTVSGGGANVADGTLATIGGGSSHEASSDYSTIAGGRDHTASGENATVGGGFTNMATAQSATVGGGGSNLASGSHATVPGGHINAARGNNSFAVGRGAKANDDNTFVWNDASGATDTLATGTDSEFVARARNGFRFYTNAAATTGALLPANTGAWAPVSDVNVKTGFDPTDPVEVLEKLASVPIQTWRYEGQDESITHMGPTAQDFYSAFGLGIDDRHIVTVDADGVAMAAIQGLYELVQQQQREIERLRELIGDEF